MPRGKRSLPEGITFKGTHRQFKQQKRAELRAVKKALRAVAHGCALTPIRRLEVDRGMAGAFMPGYVYMSDVQNIVDQWIKQCSVKNWGR
jgi:hypothetical protein